MRRRDLLLGAASLAVPAPVLGRTGSAPTASGARHLVVVFAEGGWDVTFCFDPKLSCTAPGGGSCPVEGPEVDEDPDDPEDREAVRTFAGIPVVVNDRKRPAVSAFFQRWADVAHVVNGIWSGSIAHVPCRYRMLTATQDGRGPDMATIAGQVHGAGLPLGSIDLSGWSITGPLAASSGRLGASSQLVGLLDPELLHAPAGAPFAYPVFTPHPEDEALLAAWTRRRSDALRRRFGDGGGNDRTLDDLDASLVRGDAFRSLADPILSALSVGRVSSLAEQADIAVQMLATGVCHAVTLDTRERWDTHDVNSAQHGMFQRTFSALDHLMAALRDAGLLDRTVVAVVSEMTRTPLRNASTGKDHWGHGSALLLGAVRGGTVSGSTDHQVESLPMDLATGVPDPEGELCRYDSFCAGLLELVDVDPGDWLPGVVPFRGARPT